MDDASSSKAMARKQRAKNLSFKSRGKGGKHKMGQRVGSIGVDGWKDSQAIKEEDSDGNNDGGNFDDNQVKSPNPKSTGIDYEEILAVKYAEMLLHLPETKQSFSVNDWEFMGTILEPIQNNFVQENFLDLDLKLLSDSLADIEIGEWMEIDSDLSEFWVREQTYSQGVPESLEPSSGFVQRTLLEDNSTVVMKLNSAEERTAQNLEQISGEDSGHGESVAQPDIVSLEDELNALLGGDPIVHNEEEILKAAVSHDDDFELWIDSLN